MESRMDIQSESKTRSESALRSIKKQDKDIVSQAKETIKEEEEESKDDKNVWTHFVIFDLLYIFYIQITKKVMKGFFLTKLKYLQNQP